MKKWIKRITGIADLEAAAEAATATRIAEEERLVDLAKQKHEAEELAAKAKNKAELARMTPKDRATAKGEPWINVLDIHLNEDNIRNGFFELDWNALFVQELVLNGYGTKDDPEEEVVDRWFKEIVYQMLGDDGLDTRRGSGYVNVTPISGGKSEVS